MKNTGKIKRKNRHYMMIRRFLKGLISESEENNFFELLKVDNGLRECAMSEALLCKAYEIQQEQNRKISKELEIISVDCLPFPQSRDISVKTDNI